MKKRVFVSFIIIVLLALAVLPSQVGAVTDISNKLSGISIKTVEVKPGGKVYIDLTNLDSSVNKVNIYMEVEGKYLTIEVKDIHNDPYFDMPTNAIPGQSYNMGMVEIIDNEGNRKTYGTYELNYGNKTVTVTNIAIKNLSIKESRILTKSDKLYLNLETTDNVNFVTVLLKNDALQGVLLSIQDLKGNPYIDLANTGTQKLYEGEYYISDVFLNPTEQEKYVHYAKDNSSDNSALKLEFNVNFTIKENNADSYETVVEEITNLNSITLEKSKAKLNDKVYVNIDSDEKLNQVLLSFLDSNSNKTMVVYLKDLNTDKPYFIVPYTTDFGTYDLNYVILKNDEGKETHYRKGVATSEIKHFDFNSSITIDEKGETETSTIFLNNEKITDDIIDEIRAMEDNIAIEVDANNNPVIEETLFEAIKDSDKILIIKYKDTEWIFNGKDITNLKSIDVSINIYTSEDENNSEINSMIDTGIILKFAENGQLPGKCLIRILAQEDITEVLKNNIARVYYYNEDENNFNKVKMQTILTDDDYYEFYINHNSKYIMTASEIDEKYLSSDTSDLELNENISNTTKLEITTKEETTILNTRFIIQIAVIIVCVIILILIGTGKILSNKKEKIKNE